ncbi:Hypothetical predicted protein [Octopus vulgaris]|uniref:Uncharacterized protein n=1 Tax=Octopus vulgaris TaxID=6645 RepID=A0AA36AI86_OCTVU|nr:Hypothetical predicted protein [Octopus vulgaris]
MAPDHCRLFVTDDMILVMFSFLVCKLTGVRNCGRGDMASMEKPFHIFISVNSDCDGDEDNDDDDDQHRYRKPLL